MPDSIRPLILVVDDSPADRKLFRRMLEKAGYAVAEASSGPEAIEALMNTRFDLMILDLRMPGLDGLELLHNLRSMPKPKIIAATDSSYPRLLELARQLGASSTLEKTLADGELVPMVQALLTRPASSGDGINLTNEPNKSKKTTLLPFLGLL